MKKYYHQHQQAFIEVGISVWLALCIAAGILLSYSGCLDASVANLKHNTRGVYNACLINSAWIALIIIACFFMSKKKRKGGCYGN